MPLFVKDELHCGGFRAPPPWTRAELPVTLLPAVGWREGVISLREKGYLGYVPAFTLAPLQSNQQRAARWGLKNRSQIMAHLCSKTEGGFPSYLI